MDTKTSPMTKNKNTERKIFEAATELFLEQGVDRTSVRDIAAKAGINLALMNYYFRSKENLFEAIFSMLIKKNTGNLVKVLNSELPLTEKITQYVIAFIDVLSANPLLASFVMSIIHRNPDTIIQIKNISNLYSTEAFRKQILDEAAKGTIREVDPAHFFVDMISMILFPFAIKSLIKDRNQFDETKFVAFINQRKEHVPQMLLSFLEVKKG